MKTLIKYSLGYFAHKLLFELLKSENLNYSGKEKSIDLKIVFKISIPEKFQNLELSLTENVLLVWNFTKNARNIYML